jgi:hypothetical protein
VASSKIDNPAAEPLQAVQQRDQAVLKLILAALQDAERKGKPPGTFLVVNLDTGDYVTAEGFMDANTAFTNRFPNSRGFAHRLGETLFEPLGIDSL